MQRAVPLRLKGSRCIVEAFPGDPPAETNGRRSLHHGVWDELGAAPPHTADDRDLIGPAAASQVSHVPVATLLDAGATDSPLSASAAPRGAGCLPRPSWRADSWWADSRPRVVPEQAAPAARDRSPLAARKLPQSSASCERGCAEPSCWFAWRRTSARHPVSLGRFLPLHPGLRSHMASLATPITGTASRSGWRRAGRSRRTNSKILVKGDESGRIELNARVVAAGGFEPPTTGL
jgi:hypothetical protein